MPFRPRPGLGSTTKEENFDVFEDWANDVERQIEEASIGQILPPSNPGLTPGNVIYIGEGVGLPTGINTTLLIGDGAPNYENVIGGLLATVNTATSNVPSGGPGTGDGALASPNGSWVVLTGGYDNVVNGWAVVLSGFHNKVGHGANHITVAGGSIHEVAALVQHAVISGGTVNKLLAGADYSVIAGGAQNEVSGIYGVVGGGTNNKATARSSLVLGGEGSTASANYATVLGGYSNTATGTSSTAGGQSNTAEGAHSVALGRENRAAKQNSVALGRGSETGQEGSLAMAGGFFGARGDAQIVQGVLRTATTDATPKKMFTNGTSEPFTVPVDSTWAFTAIIAARRTDADNESAGFRIEGVIDRNQLGSSVALVGTPTVTVLGRDNAAWTVAVTADTSNGSLLFTVTGEAGKSIRWVARVDLAQVSG